MALPNGWSKFIALHITPTIPGLTLRVVQIHSPAHHPYHSWPHPMGGPNSWPCTPPPPFLALPHGWSKFIALHITPTIPGSTTCMVQIHSLAHYPLPFLALPHAWSKFIALHVTPTILALPHGWSKFKAQHISPTIPGPTTWVVQIHSPAHHPHHSWPYPMGGPNS